MDRGKMPHAMRWCVVHVDTSLVALEYTGEKIFGYPVIVDEAQRVVCSGKRTPIPWPMEVPPESEWINAVQVDDTQFAIPVTLLVFRCCTNAPWDRPTKRVRRDPSTFQTSDETTRFLFFTLSGDGSSIDWQLQLLGDVMVEGGSATLQLHVVHGPNVVVFNTTTSTLLLLQTAITEEEILGCQLVAEDVTTTSHLLFQYAETQQMLQDGSKSEWRPSSERRRQWATLAFVEHQSTDVTISPCSYLPSCSVAERAIDNSDQVTSCVFIPTRFPNGQPDAGLASSTPELRPSVVALIGLSNSTLQVVSNGILLASYIVAGLPLSIDIVNADQCSESAIIAAISCAGADRSFHLLSIDVWGDRHRVASPLQHFTFVGSMYILPLDDEQARGSRIVLLNNTSPFANEDYLSLSLRKSVIVNCKSMKSNHALSSCHRLKYRTDDKSTASRKRGGNRHEENGEDGFQVIERVKIDSRDRDFNHQDHRTRSHSSASEQQLEMLTKSLEQRLRIGAIHSDRLERVCRDKMGMVNKLKALLTASDEHSECMSSTHSLSDSSLEMVQVVTADQSCDSGAVEVSMNLPRRRSCLNHSSVLMRSSIISYDRSSSHLRMILDVQARLGQIEDEFITLAGSIISVFAFGCTNATEAMRSWSRVMSISPPLPREDSSHRRINVEVIIEVPPSLRRRRQHLVKFGLWLRVEPTAIINMSTRDEGTHRATICQIGEVEVDLISLAGESHRNSFWSTTTSRASSPKDEYLFVSGGSSIREMMAKRHAKSNLIPSQLKVVRPLFGVLACDPSPPHAYKYCDDEGLDELLRSMPHDVVTMMNPITTSNLELIRNVIRLLQSELDQIFSLEKHQTDENGAGSTNINPVVSSQRMTDSQVLLLLNDLQRRIDFHSSWVSITQ